MEQTPSVIRTQPVGQLTLLKMPFYMRLVAFLLTGFALANMETRAQALIAVAQTNPFTVYADIVPGQAASAIETFAFSCADNLDEHHNPIGLSCALMPAEGVFAKVVVIISKGTIQYVRFTMRENNLTVGDLELLLETQAVYKFSKIMYFTLPMLGRPVVTNALGYARRSSLFLSVWDIAFTEQ